MDYATPAANEVLVVDLDGTLIRTDLRSEVFWSTLAHYWKARATTPDDRQGVTPPVGLDVAFLPYKQEVVAFIREWRKDGGRTVLVSSSNQALAERIAHHLGLFDEVYGRTGDNDLKGAGKGTFLEDRFGRHGFAYLSGAVSDLPVWAIASRAITVDAPASVKSRVNSLGPDTQHLATARGSLGRGYLRALRPHQWLKNALVFVPMIAGHNLTMETFWLSLLAFLAFSLVASSVYVVNDLLDLGADRAHPRKRNRPFASGSIPITHGAWLAPLLLMGGLAVAWPLGLNFVLVMLSYCAATLAYSLYIKRQVIADICTLAGLYTLRIVAGGVATGILLSVWLLAFAIFIFFALASVKRQAELVDSISANAIQVGRGYQADDLPLVAGMAMSSGYVSVLVLALYVNSPDVQELYSSPSALWGICFVLLYWISRMVMITQRGNMHDDPLVYAVKDPISRVCFLIVVACAVGGTLI